MSCYLFGFFSNPIGPYIGAKYQLEKGESLQMVFSLVHEDKNDYRYHFLSHFHFGKEWNIPRKIMTKKSLFRLAATNDNPSKYSIGMLRLSLYFTLTLSIRY
jgi:hypothetical protein